MLHVRGAPVIPGPLRTPGGLRGSGRHRIAGRFRVRVGLVIPLALLACLFSPLTVHAQNAREIIDRVDRLMRGESSIALFTMDIRTENWDRSLTLRAWSLGTEHALIRVEAPQKEAGTATLRADQEVWNYLPRVDRTLKLPSSMMAGSWMGSHFSNDDLVKESRLIDDYEIEIEFDGIRDGVEVWEFLLVPLPEAPVVWGKIRYQVTKEDLLPTWTRYYDESDELIRTMTFSENRMMGSRLVPTVMTIQPADKPGESTVIRYHELDFDVDLDEDFFSLRNLRRQR
ncbi:MAG: outer membrane lipoprotein-sorting protein [Bacteroidetes bacterium]|nr:outer membrane lipoprotein-sorting protein [Bacteroidota bacterium]